MLKHFTVFQPRSESGTPLCYALLCVGKDKSKPYAYAWVDTITDPSRLTVKVVEHDSKVAPRKVIDAINTLCNTDLDHPDELLDALYDHMVDKAEGKLESRQRWYEAQRRKYIKSHYATQDAAEASRPSFQFSQLESRLKAERHELKFYKKPQLLNETTGRARRWVWDDYEEMPNLQTWIEAHSQEAPLGIRHRFATARLKKHFKSARCNTPKMRLVHLLEQVNKFPRYDYASYRLTYARGKADQPWHVLVPQWMSENPAPLANKDVKTLAQMDYDERGELFAEQMTWVGRWYRIEARILGFTPEDVSRYTWNAESREFDTEPMTVDVKEELQI